MDLKRVAPLPTVVRQTRRGVEVAIAKQRGSERYVGVRLRIALKAGRKILKFVWNLAGGQWRRCRTRIMRRM